MHLDSLPNKTLHTAGTLAWNPRTLPHVERTVVFVGPCWGSMLALGSVAPSMKLAHSFDEH